MTDHRWNFPRADLGMALDGLAALRVEMGLPVGTLPGDALGDPRDTTGAIVVPTPTDSANPAPVTVAWIGRPGSAATTFEDPAGKTVTLQAKGDPNRFYMHLRTDKAAPGFDPSRYGLVPTDPAESAAVLGVWAGDEVPA